MSLDNARLRSIIIGVVVGGMLSLISVALPRVQGEQLIRMGVVNWEQVVTNYSEYQSEIEELQQRRMRVLEYIKGQGKDVDEQALKQGNEEELNAEMRKIYQDTLKQINQRRSKLQKEYQQKIYEAIRNEAIKQGYSLVLSENEVLYASQEYTDLTHDVLTRLNEESDGE